MVRKVPAEVAVAATRQAVRVAVAGRFRWLLSALCALSLWLAVPVHAAVLPDDRVDIEYSNYGGGGVDIDGPMVLVRKKIGDKVSVSGHYVIDNVSGASIDVQVAASPYEEKRTEYMLGVDYLNDKTIMSLGYVSSEENDHDSDTVSAGVSQEFFGNMTTVSFGVSHTADDLTKTGTPEFEERMTSDTISIGVSQVITKNALLALNFEEISDEGFLRNPYRFVRVWNGLGGGVGDTESNDLLVEEKYPDVRTSDAYALRGSYYLPYRAAVQAEYRTYKDTWGIGADTYFIGYTHPWKQWTFDASARLHRQSSADFFYDLLMVDGQYTFQARDKELSDMESQTLGVKASYEVPYHWWSAIDRTIVTLHVDHIKFSYNEFRDMRDGNSERYGWGNEPLYEFSVNVVRLYLSFRF